MAAKNISIIDQMDNLSLVLHKKGDLRLQQWPIPEKLLPNECLLQTHSCGICGTDIHFWEEGCMSDFKITKPLVLGHETSATVIDVGSNVTKVKPGDRVAIEPAVPCLKCYVCRTGKYNLCPTVNMQSRGLPPFDGCLRRYFTHPEEFVFKLSDNVSMEEGAMCEPFAVVVHACRRANISVGQNVLVCGAGTMGIMSMLCAKSFGANKVSIIDINPKKLAFAKENGAFATYLIDPNENFDAIEMAQKIKTDMGDPPDVTIECTGAESCLKLSIYATKYGGKVAMVGLGPTDIKVPLVIASMHEVDLIGICRFLNDFPLAIHLIESGKVNLKPLATHKFKIEDAIEAFRMMKYGNGNSVKIMIQF